MSVASHRLSSPLKLGIAVLITAGIVAQVVRIDTVNPPVTADFPAPAPIGALLRRACYDCHSNQTVWPWYSRVAPVSWLLAHDVRGARHAVNFSTWTAYPPKRQRHKLDESAEEVATRDMPPWYYLLLHPEAQLTAAEREALRAWLRGASPPGNGG